MTRGRETVAVPDTSGEALLAVAVSSGVAELSRTVLLRGSARRLIEEHGADLDRERAIRTLEAEGAGENAVRDAEAFLAELAASGLLSASPDAGAGAPARPILSVASVTARLGDTPEVGARDLERIAREVLARGYRLRFRAYGRSMRTSITPGSLLEVEPRAFADVRLGEIALTSVGDARLVAHRVVGRRGNRLLLRGDTCARLDEVGVEDHIGVVRACIAPDGSEVRLSTGPRRVLGLTQGLAWRTVAFLARHLVVRPLRASALLRALVWNTFRIACGVGIRLERLSKRLRRPLDVGRAALLSEREKDERRRALYERRTVQSFTSLEENVAAGLTLIEEVLLTRHPLVATRGDGPAEVLVLGCGPGRECLELARRGLAVTGVDREEGMLERARELAAEEGLSIRYVRGEAVEAGGSDELADERFDVVLLFSGLYNMVLPRAARVELLRAARERLRPGGRVLLTFLSAYRHPSEGPTPVARGFWSAINPVHEPGDLFLLNEAVHVFPRGEDAAEEGVVAGLRVVEVFRDQRAYDREEGRVRGYLVLERPREA